ncbi:Uma2 family endonuclease [Phormidesmis priestleyi]|uniref:Uma2 family endonuclease n=1 Tax=Phormidesmis priestleyi TaxID=268141 RepID=UPI00083B33CF|nr:Uma2 family endonuclease [Phormidesmis priestleyi]
MTQAAVRPRVSFEEYIDFCAQTDERYELVRGELLKMTPPTWAHVLIARFLERVFEIEIERLGYDWVPVRETGQRTDDDSSRLPDVTVVPFEEIEPVLNQSAVLTVPAPIVVEIVSPSSASGDYDAKLKEYQLLRVGEYWVVDHEGLGAAKYIGFPKAPTITVYELIEGEYQAKRFRGNDRIISPTLKGLNLTANQVFVAGRQRRSTGTIGGND